MPEIMAGREAILTGMTAQMKRALNGRAARSLVLHGLRGTGKTSILLEAREAAETLGCAVSWIEAVPDKPFLQQLVAQLRKILLGLDDVEKAKAFVRKAGRALASLVKSVNVEFPGGSVGVEFDPEPGVADSGDLETDLPDLVEAVGLAAKHAETAVVLIVDELQFVGQAHLNALIVSMHRIAQRRLPVVLIGAGLPNILRQLGESRSYSERLFIAESVEPLDRKASDRVIRDTLALEDVAIELAALDAIWTESEGYPHFIQEWGNGCWTAAISSPIRQRDVDSAAGTVRESLDRGFFQMRLDRCTPQEMDYMRALASLGPGEHSPGAVARAYGASSSSQLNSTRQHLIEKGMIYAPAYGRLAFTVPRFEDFLARHTA
jgi:hypothetical protein